ncbi:hypothetical protein [Brevibacillus sp. SAFN-007a]|uniref:hypothetical protein n=1 Tax=Brevibacillus sp. SAFN-007a TaxID=3436862 RepID=UPI003F821E5E
MNEKNKTIPTDTSGSERTPINEMLEDAQRIEGSGPPTKINMKTMPRWLRIVGYSFLSLFFVFVFLLLISSLVR